MPFIRLTTSIPLPPAVSNETSLLLTDLMANVLHKKRELTAVLIESPNGPWTIGGARPPQAAHLEANITAGTNTDGEKAEFVRATMDLLGRQLAPLHEATYVIVREIPSTDWGYGGCTQAARLRRQ